MHLLVVWAAVYLTWGLALRPDWRSYRTALLVTAGWVAAMFGVNALAGTNFGYLAALDMIYGRLVEAERT